MAPIAVPYPNALALGLSLFASYVVVTVVYRLYFHPLAKFPGPFWARLTSIPAWWHSKNFDRHIWLLSLQDKYGPTFRYTPDSVCINTPTAYKAIFGPKGNVQKSDYYKIWPKEEGAINTWSATSVSQHARKRRVLNYAFSESALRNAEPFIHMNMDRWLDLLGQQKQNSSDELTNPIDMEHQVTYLVMDILGDLCFGKSFNMKEDEGSDLRHIPGLMVFFCEFLTIIAHGPWASWWLWAKPRGLNTLIAKTAPPALKSWQAFVYESLEKRTQKQREIESKKLPESEIRKDFFHWLFNAKDPETGEGYSLPELYAECEMLIIAGSDTTAIVISAAFFYLSRYPEVQEKLAREIRETFERYDDIKGGAKLQNCKYLTAFLHEAMRMAPPLGAEPPRVVREGGMTIDGHYFPPGSLVSTAFWAQHYNPEYYPQPLQFRPERWIVGDAPDGSSKEEVATAEDAFCAFSIGSRGCVGKNLAWVEMRIVIAKTLWRFVVKKDPTSNLGGGSENGKPSRRVRDQYQTWDCFVASRQGPMVQLAERKH